MGKITTDFRQIFGPKIYRLSRDFFYESGIHFTMKKELWFISIFLTITFVLFLYPFLLIRTLFKGIFNTIVIFHTSKINI